MKLWIGAAVLIFSVSVQAAPAKRAAPAAPKQEPVPSVLYDFKGVPLGITIDEFRARPHPDGAADAKVICTGEKILRFRVLSEPFQVAIYDDVEKALGMKKCVWVTTKEDKAKYTYAGEVVSLALAGSGYGSRDYEFSFVPDPRDGVLRLFKVKAVSNRNAFSDVLQGLTGKWGVPKLVNGTVQNKMGATFPETTALWTNPAASITVIDRWTKVDEMVILLSENRLGTIVQQAKDAKKATIPNAI